MASGQKLGVFGKVPAFDDFYSRGAHPRLVRTTDDWVRRGIELTSSRNAIDFRVAWQKATPLCIALPADSGGAGKCIVSVLPSVDRMDRIYPLLVFLEYPGGDIDGADLIRLYRACSQVAPLETRFSLPGDVDSSVVEAFASNPTTLTSQDLREFEATRRVGEPLGGVTDTYGHVTYRQVLWDLLGIRWDAKQGLTPKHLIIQLPLPSDDRWIALIDHWLVLLRATLDSVGDVSLAWSFDPAAGPRLFATLLPLKPRLFASWIEPEVSHETLFRVGLGGEGTPIEPDVLGVEEGMRVDEARQRFEELCAGWP